MFNLQKHRCCAIKNLEKAVITSLRNRGQPRQCLTQGPEDITSLRKQGLTLARLEDCTIAVHCFPAQAGVNPEQRIRRRDTKYYVPA